MAMELPLKLNPAKERRLKYSAGCRCELCGEAFPADLLEIHLLPGNGARLRGKGDLEREILVLCPGCHRDVHAFAIPRPEQKILVRSRPAPARKEMRAILGDHPVPYTPPEVDLAALYEETRQLSGFVLNGAG